MASWDVPPPTVVQQEGRAEPASIVVRLGAFVRFRDVGARSKEIHPTSCQTSTEENRGPERESLTALGYELQTRLKTLIQFSPSIPAVSLVENPRSSRRCVSVGKWLASSRPSG